MAYMSQVTVEKAPFSFNPAAPAAISGHYAVEAANILLARSPTHARRFALAMHKRVAGGLDTEVIEHWARVVTELSRVVPRG